MCVCVGERKVCRNRHTPHTANNHHHKQHPHACLYIHTDTGVCESVCIDMWHEEKEDTQDDHGGIRGCVVVVVCVCVVDDDENDLKNQKVRI